jgi:DNA processing protein
MTLDEDLEDAAAVGGGRLPTGEPHPGLRRARAWLSRATEPGTIDLWRFVDAVGPVDAARQLRAGRAPERIR